MTLNKRYLRNIKSNLSFYLSIILLTVLIIYIFIAISSSYEQMRTYLSDGIKKTNREDAQFTLYAPISAEDIASYEKTYDVELEEMHYQEQVLSSDSKDEVTVRLFAPSSRINLYEIAKGQDITADDEILLNQLFAEKQGIAVGDTIKINNYTMKVVGYAIRYDYLFCLKNTNDTFSTPSTFGIGIVTREAYDHFLISSEEQSYYSIRYHNDNEAQVQKALYDQFVISSYVDDSINNRIQTPNDQVDELSNVTTVFLPVSMLLLACLIAVVLGRKVRNEKRLIGILHALGVKRWELAFHYCLFGMIPGIAGGLLGTLIGYAGSEPMLGMMFEGKMEPLPFQFHFTPAVLGIGILAPAMVYSLTVFLSAFSVIHGNPIDLIRQTSPRKQRHNMRLTFLKTSFRTKYRLRALFGNFGRTLTLFFGVAIGGILLVFMLACIDSIEAFVFQSVDEAGSFEYEYFLNEMLVPSEAEQILDDGSNGFLAVSFGVRDANDYVTVMGMEENPYLVLENEDGDSLVLEDGKYYLSSMGAMIYGVSKGDVLKFYDIASQKEYEIAVDDIFDNGTQNLLVTTNTELCKLISDKKSSLIIPDGTINAIMSNHKLEIPKQQILKEVTKRNLKKQLRESILDSMKQLLVPVEVLAALILVIVIYMMVNLFISESTVTISMLKVLGYYDREINRIITYVYHAVAMLGMLFGLYLGFELTKINFEMSSGVYNCYITTIIHAKSVVQYVAVTVVSYVVTMLLLNRKVGKVSMVESLKDHRE